ncbi:major fimbrial subunit MrfA [Edwardsiella piscicida]|uniref:Putative mannose-resistant/Proteus-like fimbrial protein n=1 Tax=Edwardsiella anguillarum ET080813 TaxID=667120 RepID=A0A076LF08_9GAMM|nr:putative mannose-resistant/Proteus-like fimbrial protein [Edwardsiella anguillarum ET080813]GAJ66130.1 major fimbrial subunit MrfA [Edwardsiella piscicida]
MKLNKLVVMLGLVAATTSGAAFAATEGSGTVTFKGAIIDAPCSITPDTTDQTVNLGQVSSNALLGGVHLLRSSLILNWRDVTFQRWLRKP